MDYSAGRHEDLAVNVILNKKSLLSALDGADPLALVARADAQRRKLHGRLTRYVLLRSLNWGAGERFSPLSGIELADSPDASLPGGTPHELGTAVLERAHPAAGDYQIILKRGISSAQLVEYAGACASALAELGSSRSNGNSAAGARVLPTFQLGNADLWIDAGADASVLGEARAAGLRLVSDGVRPRNHPAHGEAAARSWTSFWRAAGEAGLRGNASVLFGPAHDPGSVIDQLEAIARVQHECGVFNSLAPVIHDPKRPEGGASAALTQGRQDLQVFALSRVCPSGIEHLRMLYACSDLKMAHLTLASGVDDLEGHLFDGKRTPCETADTFDMNLDEIEAWLNEAGYEPVLRNGIFEEFPRESDEA